MDRRILTFAFLIPALLAGCMAVPMTPTEYRTATKKGEGLSMYESFVVKRPVAEVGQTFRKKADECLNLAIGSQNKPLIGFAGSVHYYGQVIPTVTTSGSRAELHLQVKYKNQVGPIPQNGMYYFVADAYPNGKGATRVDIYRRTKFATVAEAVKGWASGQNMGCPDPHSFL